MKQPLPFFCPSCGQPIENADIARHFASMGGKGNTKAHMKEISKLAAEKRIERARLRKIEIEKEFLLDQEKGEL